MNDDRRLADLIDDALRPRPMDRVARVAFRRSVEERIERRAMPRWIGGLALVTSGALAVAIWLASPSVTAPTAPPPEIAREEAPAPVAKDRGETVLAAYADPDVVLEDIEGADYLPDDYVVLASVVDEIGG